MKPDLSIRWAHTHFIGFVMSWLMCPSAGIYIAPRRKEIKPEDHSSCIAHLSAEEMLKSAVIEEKKFKNIESDWSRPRSVNGLDIWYS